MFTYRICILNCDNNNTTYYYIRVGIITNKKQQDFILSFIGFKLYFEIYYILYKLFII